jgi:hypothetical protein
MKFLLQKENRDDSFRGQTLRTEVKFVAYHCVVFSCEERVSLKNDTHYWIIRDRYGCQFSCWDKKIIDLIQIGESYTLHGKVAISKGGIFLNIQQIDQPPSLVNDLNAPESSSEDESEPPLDG